MLKGKHIVLGISGSIAAYKAASLTRLFVKNGAEVQIVITSAGKEFITPITLSTLSSKPVISEFFSGRDGSWNSHVDIGLWADLMIVAPATASTIAKMANGVADNMLITTYLSMKAPVMIAPAMDLDMYKHPSTQDNLDSLRKRGNIIIESASGELASHLVGKGRMEEPENILKYVVDFFNSQNKISNLKGKRAVITAGPTHEYIDPVRYLSNSSTGLMGISIANELSKRGVEVDLILGPSSLSPDSSVKTYRVTSALEMYEKTKSLIDKSDIAIFSAAVADYRIEEMNKDKIKRGNNYKMSLSFIKNPDIAAEMGKIKKNNQFFLGFSLETDKGEDEAKRKLKSKNMDAIVLNTLKDEGAGFATKTNKISIFDKNEIKQSFDLKDKTLVARDIVDFIENQI